MSKVKSVERIGSADVYNMEVKEFHNFSVNGGIIVHNCDSLRYFAVEYPIVAIKPVPPKVYATYDEYAHDKIFSKIGKKSMNTRVRSESL